MGTRISWTSRMQPSVNVIPKWQVAICWFSLGLCVYETAGLEFSREKIMFISFQENISEARECLRNYTCTVRQAVQLLSAIEASVMPPLGSDGPCSEMQERTQRALTSLQQQFQTHVEKLQSRATLHPYLSPAMMEQFQENILSQVLVRMSTLQAKGHLRLECLSR